MPRITSFNPGQRPPQVTMPQASVDGLKNTDSLGPADSIDGGAARLSSQGRSPATVE